MDFQKALIELNSNDNKVLFESLKVISMRAFREPSTVESIITDIKSKLHHTDENICSYSCWTAGLIGRNRPEWYSDEIDYLFELLNHTNEKIRENALFALGWIGRAQPNLVEDKLERIIDMHKDRCPKVRVSMIWASENIANTKPELFVKYIDVYENLLNDQDTRFVRGEAPEFFRVMGKSRPDIVQRSIKKLEGKLEDENRVTRIHSQGALKEILKNLKVSE